MTELTCDTPGYRTACIVMSEIVYQTRPLSPLPVLWFSHFELVSNTLLNWKSVTLIIYLFIYFIAHSVRLIAICQVQIIFWLVQEVSMSREMKWKAVGGVGVPDMRTEIWWGNRS